MALSLFNGNVDTKDIRVVRNSVGYLISRLFDLSAYDSHGGVIGVSVGGMFIILQKKTASYMSYGFDFTALSNMTTLTFRSGRAAVKIVARYCNGGLPRGEKPLARGAQRKSNKHARQEKENQKTGQSR